MEPIHCGWRHWSSTSAQYQGGRYVVDALASICWGKGLAIAALEAHRSSRRRECKEKQRNTYLLGMLALVHRDHGAGVEGSGTIIDGDHGDLHRHWTMLSRMGIGVAMVVIAWVESTIWALHATCFGRCHMRFFLRGIRFCRKLP